MSAAYVPTLGESGLRREREYSRVIPAAGMELGPGQRADIYRYAHGDDGLEGADPLDPIMDAGCQSAGTKEPSGADRRKA